MIKLHVSGDDPHVVKEIATSIQSELDSLEEAGWYRLDDDPDALHRRNGNPSVCMLFDRKCDDVIKT